MAEVVVVEDSPDQIVVMTALLEKAGHNVRTAENGSAALESIEQQRPDVVTTDLVMPGMSGLELVEAIRARHPNLPVILVTAFGSGEIAVEALKKGAASYVPKHRLMEDLISTVDNVLAVARETRQRTRLLKTLVESRFRFVLPNDEHLIAGLVDFLQDRICYRHPACDENVLMQIGIAVQESIRNAMHHGNLEVSSELRHESTAAYDTKVQERLRDPAYAKREVVVEAEFTRTGFKCSVRDQGPGFNPKLVPDPTDPENLLKTSGRGIYLITMFMDEVTYNDTGTQIVMRKELSSP